MLVAALLNPALPAGRDLSRRHPAPPGQQERSANPAAGQLALLLKGGQHVRGERNEGVEVGPDAGLGGGVPKLREVRQVKALPVICPAKNRATHGEVGLLRGRRQLRLAQEVGDQLPVESGEGKRAELLAVGDAQAVAQDDQQCVDVVLAGAYFARCLIMIACSSNRFARSLPGKLLQRDQPFRGRLVEDDLSLGFGGREVRGAQADALPFAGRWMAEVQPVKRRGVNLVECSGESAVRDGGVHARNMALAFAACQTLVCRTVSQCARAMSAGVAKAINLTGLSGRLRNSVNRGIWESPV